MPTKRSPRRASKVAPSPKLLSTRWFHYSQNNSGGSFTYDAKAGITHHVVIEAVDVAHANARAESIGLYWDGCDDGRDCSCCGDRWSKLGEWGKEEGHPEPMVYDCPADKLTGVLTTWMEEGREVAVHPLDGAVRWYGVSKEKVS